MIGNKKKLTVNSYKLTATSYLPRRTAGKLQANNYGFTAVEIVTAAGIFVVVVVLLLNLFIVFSRAQRSAGARQKIVSEINYFYEKLAQELRTYEIIYDGTFNYGFGTQNVYSQDESGISGKEVELALQNEDNEEIYYIFDSGTNIRYDCRSGQGLYRFFRSNVVECQKILDVPNLTITDVGFYINPSSNPHPDSNDDCGDNSSYNGYFCTCSAGSDCHSGTCTSGRCVLDDEQPRATVYLEINDTINNRDIIIQTSSSGRVYKR